MSSTAERPVVKMERGEAAPRRGRMSLELGCAMALLVGAVLLRLASIFHYRFDNDEPQHLHVVWAWTQGLVQYRDVFDNHMPLFHTAMYAKGVDLWIQPRPERLRAR